MGHLDDVCVYPEGASSSDSAQCPILPENVVAAGGEESIDRPCLLVEENRTIGGGGKPKIGPWSETSRIRQPLAPRAPVRGRRHQDKLKEMCPDSSDPRSSSSPLNSPRNNTSSPNSPSDSDSWQKPTKVAHHRSLGSGEGEPSRDDAAAGNGFAALGPLGDKMNLGLTEDSDPRDVAMIDPSMGSLKRARSPSKLVPSNMLSPIHGK